MKRFEFRLSAKLRLTVQEERQALWEYRERAAELTKEEEIFNTLIEVRKKLWETLRLSDGHSLNVNELLSYQQFLPVVEKKVKAQAKRVDEAQDRLNKARDAFLKIRTERRMLEKLKERAYQEYLADCLREEQKQIDEVATMGHPLKKSARAGDGT